MNQENNKVQTQVQQLTPEELQKTQVLNLQELEETIKFEKKTSKKPALIVSILGIISIVFGSSYLAIQTLSTKKETSNVQKKEVKENVVDKKLTTSKLACEKIELNHPDGTDTDFTINYTFDKDKLTAFTKKLIITQTAGNAQGLATVESYKLAYQSFLNPTKGYQITVAPKDTTGLIVTVQVDFEKLDIAALNPTQATHFSTSIDYPKDTDKKTIQTALVSQGYTCK